MEEFLKKLKERLGLAEDASDEDVLDALTKVKKADDTPPPPVEGVALKELRTAFGLSETATKEDILEKASEARPKEITRMTQMEKQFPEEAKMLREQAVQLDDLQLDFKLAEWHRGGEAGAIPVSLDEKVGQIRKALPPSGREVFDGFIAELLNIGLAPMQEIGSADKRHLAVDDKDAFLLAVKEQQQRDPKLPYGEAVKLAARENPQLAESYRKSTKKAAGEEVS